MYRLSGAGANEVNQQQDLLSCTTSFGSGIDDNHNLQITRDCPTMQMHE